MAACLITISGTEGLLRLNYKIGTDSYIIETSIGTFYIEDTATDVTYTTLSGDLIASSLCLTITELSYNCYTIGWSKLLADNYKIVQVILGSTSYNLDNIFFPNSEKLLIDAINNLNINEIKCIGYKKNKEVLSNYPTLIFYNLSYVLRIIGTDFPILKVSNGTSTNFIYINGIEYLCNNMETDGYEVIDVPLSTFSTP